MDGKQTQDLLRATPQLTNEQQTIQRNIERQISNDRVEKGIQAGGVVVAALTFAFIVTAIIFWLTALVSILKRDFKNSADKIVWILVIFFIPLLGPILYYLIGRNKK